MTPVFAGPLLLLEDRIVRHLDMRFLLSWLVDHGAALDHTAKYGLSALMLAVIGGCTDVVRILTAAGADLCLRGTGTPGFTAKTALDLAIARGDPDMVEILRTGASCRPK